MFKNPFSYDGRIRRTEYGLSIIIYYILYLGIFFISESMGDAGAFVLLLAMIPLFWFTTAQAAKRCHDIGKSGWWQLVPFFNPFALLFSSGDFGRNEYGSDPKNPDQVEDMLGSETLDSHLRDK